MNFLKSAFVMMYMMGAMGLCIYAGYALFSGGSVLAWTGVLLTAAPFMTFISWIMMMRNVARTSANFPVLIALGGIGLTLSIWAWAQQSGPFLAIELAGAGWVGFLIYSFWYSGFGKRSSRIRIGSTLPDFVLKSSKGGVRHSSDFVGKASILIFYRGNWCPLCMAQVKELAKRYQDLEAANVRVAMISPQPHKNTVSLAKKFDIGFEFYTDENNQAARALGIANPFGIPLGMQMLGYKSETVLPTVVIIDAQGRVLWLHETDNYRIRPEPDVFLGVLQEHGLATT
ncbi:MAG: alkyl hydroperoxide reductase [Robiginitomaculum sp.]|nr:MAG: alkyl hydroperoxide reductase [Robiginitomaculum sp.]